jgi:hypothetical protein
MSNETKVTAVEWLVNEINARGPKENNPPKWLKELYEQAQAMEKEQHFESYRCGNLFLDENSLDFEGYFEQYYKETYEK